MGCTEKLENGELCGKSEIVNFTCKKCGYQGLGADYCPDHMPKEKQLCSKCKVPLIVEVTGRKNKPRG